MNFSLLKRVRVCAPLLLHSWHGGRRFRITILIYIPPYPTFPYPIKMYLTLPTFQHYLSIPLTNVAGRDLLLKVETVLPIVMRFESPLYFSSRLHSSSLSCMSLCLRSLPSVSLESSVLGCLRNIPSSSTPS